MALAVYQRDRALGGTGCILCFRPVVFRSFLNKWREERDVPRYRRLGDAEDVGPYILDDVLPQISAGNDKRLPKGQFARTPFPFIPRFFEEFTDHLLQFIELR
jgi:hypothetical protein